VSESDEQRETGGEAASAAQGGGAVAGWYDDPAGSGGLRWWDGSRWSDHVQPSAPQTTTPHAAAAQPEAETETAQPAAITPPPSPIEPVVPPQSAPAAEQRPEVSQPAYPQYGQQAQYGQPQYGEAQGAHTPPQSGYPAAPAYGAYPAAEPRKVGPETPVYGPFIWIITLLPVLSLLLLPLSLVGLEDSIRVQVIGDGYNSYSYGTGGMSGAALLAQSVATLLGWLIYAAQIVLAFFDRKWLLARGFDRPFHWAFAFIPAPVYPIGRSVVVKRRSGRGIAPMWVSIGLLALGLIIGIGVFIWVIGLSLSMIDSGAYVS
jgi:hypothetical protein